MKQEDREKLREANRRLDQALASNDLDKVIEIMRGVNALLDSVCAVGKNVDQATERSTDTVRLVPPVT